MKTKRLSDCILCGSEAFVYCFSVDEFMFQPSCSNDHCIRNMKCPEMFLSEKSAEAAWDKLNVPIEVDLDC